MPELVDNRGCGHTKLYTSNWRGTEQYPSCLLCQVDSLERRLKESEGKLSAALGRLGLQQDENGCQYDEIDRLQMALELRDGDLQTIRSRLGDETARADA